MDDDRIIVGVNSVCEAIKAKKNIEKILVTVSTRGKIQKHLQNLENKNGIPIKIVDKRKIDSLFPSCNHQGVIAFISDFKYSELEDIFELAERKRENEFVVIADSIEDPHNLGAIIRTAECMGAHGVVIPQRRSAHISVTVSKTSSGAIEHIPIVRVKNLSETLKTLKKRGLWIYCSDMSGQNLYETDFYEKIALVIGNEGHGVSRLVKENSDFILKIPMKGHVESLNASVAAGILMSECFRQRYNLKSGGGKLL